MRRSEHVALKKEEERTGREMVHVWASKLVVRFLKRLAALADRGRWPPAGVLSDQ